MAEVAEGVDVDTAVTREEAGALAVQGDATYSPECVEGSPPEARRDYTTTRDRAATTRGSNWLSAPPISSPTASVGGRGPL